MSIMSVNRGTAVLPSIAVGLMVLAFPGVSDSVAPQQLPYQQWEFKSEVYIYAAKPASDGGAIVATSSCGQASERTATICRIASNGDIAWKYTAPDGWKLSLKDCTPDAKMILAGLRPKDDPDKMKLIFLDSDGKVTKETRLVEDSNWVWLSPEGKFVLRWVASEGNLLMESLKSGDAVWSLKNLQPSINPVEVGFVQPVWSAGCILVGDHRAKTIDAIGLSGKRLWRLNDINWETPAISPVHVTSSGSWFAAVSGRHSTLPSESQDMRYFADSVGHGSLQMNTGNSIKLMRIAMSRDNPGEQYIAELVWRRLVSTDRLSTTRRVSEGCQCIDLLERDDGKALSPSLAILTDDAVTVKDFDVAGNPQQETPWKVQNVHGVYDVRLLPSGHLLLNRPETNEQPRALQVIEWTGSLLWEVRPPEEVFSVDFDSARQFATVRMPHTVVGYRLNGNVAGTSSADEGPRISVEHVKSDPQQHNNLRGHFVE